jgi:hypothetical protein
LLSGATDDPERSSTRAHVQREVERLKSRARADDIIFIVLMGHGSADGGVAKFNLPGPDLTSAEWGSLLHDVPGRVVIVNTSGAELSVHGRSRHTWAHCHHLPPTRWRSAMTPSFRRSCWPR